MIGITQNQVFVVASLVLIVGVGFVTYLTIQLMKSMYRIINYFVAPIYKIIRNQDTINKLQLTIDEQKRNSGTHPTTELTQDNRDECLVCLEQQSDIQTLPCCRQHICQVCIPQLRDNKCPHCRTMLKYTPLTFKMDVDSKPILPTDFSDDYDSDFSD